MKFIDEATITVQSGDGGNGCVSFRREKFVPRGGPDGGDGGKGGDVVLKSTSRRRTLLPYRYKSQFNAQRGANGLGKQKTGRSGEDLILDYTATTGANPQLMLRWSDDGGHTWTGYRQASMGRIGRYGYRVFFRALGMTVKLRDRVYEISATDPVKIAIMGAELQISPTGS